MPYTHSLDGAILWSLVAGIVYWLIRRAGGCRDAAVVGGAVWRNPDLGLAASRSLLYMARLAVQPGATAHDDVRYVTETEQVP
jgi:hypothetical protein